jgi:membrane protease YdiL (CAAX protease family)
MNPPPRVITNVRPAPAVSPFTPIRQWITEHPLISFFTLTFVISWPFGFLLPALSQVMGLGPPLAAIAVSAVIAPEKVYPPTPKRLAAFAVLFVGTFAIWLLMFQYFAPSRARGWPTELSDGAVGAAIVGFVVSGIYARGRGIRDLLTPLKTWRVGMQWYLFAVLFFPALLMAGMAIDLALGGKLPPYPYAQPSLWGILLAFTWVFFFGGGFEEPGWRGFALPRMQLRFSPLVASLILGCFWALWHTPDYFNGQYTSTSGTGAPALGGIIVRFFIMTPPLVLIFTWLYNRVRGSLLLLILLHTSIDAAMAVLAISTRAYLLAFALWWIAAIVVLVMTRGRLGYNHYLRETSVSAVGAQPIAKVLVSAN